MNYQNTEVHNRLEGLAVYRIFPLFLCMESYVNIVNLLYYVPRIVVPVVEIVEKEPREREGHPISGTEHEGVCGTSWIV